MSKSTDAFGPCGEKQGLCRSASMRNHVVRTGVRPASVRRAGQARTLPRDTETEAEAETETEAETEAETETDTEAETETETDGRELSTAGRLAACRTPTPARARGSPSCRHCGSKRTSAA